MCPPKRWNRAVSESLSMPGTSQILLRINCSANCWATCLDGRQVSIWSWGAAECWWVACRSTKDCSQAWKPHISVSASCRNHAYEYFIHSFFLFGSLEHDTSLERFLKPLVIPCSWFPGGNPVSLPTMSLLTAPPNVKLCLRWGLDQDLFSQQDKKKDWRERLTQLECILEYVVLP
jgi:hypothetical protein